MLCAPLIPAIWAAPEPAAAGSTLVGQLMAWLFVLSLGYVAMQLRAPRAFFAGVGERLELFASVVMRIHHLPMRRRWLIDRLYVSAIKNMHVVLVVALFIGMILALQTGVELARYGQQDQLGVIVGASMSREMGPFITAIILAATVGSAIAAELGTMSVSDELSALEVMSVDRVSLLVLPRVAALAIACPMLTVLCDAVGIIGGGLVAKAQLNVGWEAYMDAAMFTLTDTGKVIPLPKDVYGGLFKAFIYGAIIAVISCVCGIRARGGALGVGRATSQAVRDSIIAVIIANYFLTWIIYQN